VETIYERESSLEKVVDALHAELADYKNDFLYEHLKPVVRPLLFLFDSLEQFDAEVAMAEHAMKEKGTDERRNTTLAPAVVRENTRYFRDQLVEALRVCEVTIMDAPRGAFNAKFHKAIDVVPVQQEQDAMIQRVVRSGWFLNGQLLRPAEVVVGKFRGVKLP
jgi:molecular chaperone GrpE (heat shock protein)